MTLLAMKNSGILLVKTWMVL